MNKRFVFFFFIAALLTANDRYTAAQNLEVEDVRINTAAQNLEVEDVRINDVLVSIKGGAEGRATAEGFSRWMIHGLDGLTVLMINDSTRLLIAYSLYVEPQATGAQLLVTIKPPSPENLARLLESFRKMERMAKRYPNLASYGATALPAYPPPRTINFSDRIRLTLWKNDATSANIVDELSFKLDRVIKVAPQDFSLARLRLHLSDFQLRVNGRVRSGTIRFGKFSGPLPWVYVPGKGRFIFSLQPHEGFDFQKSAVLEDKKISFNVDGETYEWLSDELIMGQRGKWHLWMLHDSAFQGEAEDLKNNSLISPGNCCLYGALEDASSLPRTKP